MNGKVTARNPALYLSLLASLFLFGFGYSYNADAASAAGEGANIQLARNGHHHGYHGHHGYRGYRGYHRGYRGYRVYRPGVYIGPGVYYGPRYRGNYWTGWRTYYRHGHRCVRRCLINRWNGAVIRCNRRCFY